MSLFLPINTTDVVNNHWIPSYQTCEYGWSYLGKILLLSRSLLNTAARTDAILSLTGRTFANKAKSLALQLKIFSIVSVPFSFVDWKFSFQKMFSAYSLGNREQTLLSTLSFTILSADIVDSITTFTNASLALSSIDPIPLFAAMGLPLGFTMSGLGTISRTVQIGKSLLLAKELQENLDSSKELKKALRSMIRKSIPSSLVKEMEKTLSLLENKTSLSSKKVIDSLNSLFYIIERKMRIDFLAVLANLLIFSALVLFSLGSIAAAPFILLSCAFSMRIFSLIYQDTTQKEIV